MLIGAGPCAIAANARTAGAGADFAAAQVVEVSLSSFDFTPSTITLHAGQPYVLHLVDRARGGHDFTAREFFEAAQIAPQDAAKVAKGAVALHGGETATVHLIPAPGTYKLVCSHFGHSMLGMKGVIVVR
ncbi:MAG: cupredoxin domain-containing protein [Novosphingobium sp.]